MQENNGGFPFLYHYRATILKVVDGDTVYVQIDLGIETYRKLRCRLLGINAPELGDPGGIEAKNYLALLLPAGSEVAVRTIKDRVEKYGRYLVEIWVEGLAGSVNEAMVVTGHAARYPAR